MYTLEEVAMPDAPLTTSTSTDVEPVAKLLRYSFLLFALPATVLFGFTSGSLDGKVLHPPSAASKMIETQLLLYR